MNISLPGTRTKKTAHNFHTPVGLEEEMGGEGEEKAPKPPRPAAGQREEVAAETERDGAVN